MMTITLKNMRFHAFHGLYPEELQIGNEFEVDLEVDYMPVPTVIQSIEETLNYVEIYAFLEARMQKPTPLLETLVMEIARGLADKYPSVREVRIGLQKLTAPIAGMQGRVGVKYVFING